MSLSWLLSMGNTELADGDFCGNGMSPGPCSIVPLESIHDEGVHVSHLVTEEGHRQ